MKNKLPLRSFRVQNFKAVHDSRTVSFGPLTVFIGNNASGKSSLIEALETFRDIVVDGLDKAMVRWRGFEHIWNHAVRHDLKYPENGRPCHTNPMTFQIRLSMPDFSVKARQEINLGENGDDLFIQSEDFVRRNQQTINRVVRDGFGRQQESLQGHDPNFDFAPTEVGPQKEQGQSILEDTMGHHLARWQFLNLVPDAMGHPTPQQRAVGRIRLAQNGANIAEYLNEIRTMDKEAFAGIFESLRYVIPFATELEPVLAKELQRQFYLRLREEDFEVPGWLLSTGTLRIVALLACLRHPEPPPLLVVEEIENGLDPRTIHLLVEEIRAATEAGKTQVIATTHSPYLLDLLDISHIVVVERVAGEPIFSRPRRNELAEWAETFSPGRLYTMGRLNYAD